MIQLQGDLHRRTALWLPTSDIWDKLGEMFDIPALDSMVCHCPHSYASRTDDQSSPPPLPDSPKELSPLPTHRGRARLKHEHDAGSASPVRDSSPEPNTGESSRSAGLINSSYFGAPFTLPYFRLGQDQWKPNLDTSSENRRRSRSVASTSTRAETEKGFMLGDDEPDMSDGEEIDWKHKIYDEDERASKGVNQEAEDEAWTKGVEQQLTAADADDGKKNAKSKGKSNLAKKKGKAGKKRQDRDDSSELSEDAEQGEGEEQDEEEDVEEEIPKGVRAKRTIASKRKRDSTTKEESEDEKEIKETVSRTLRKLYPPSANRRQKPRRKRK